MERFIQQQNIKLLQKALDDESDPEKRRVLERLLAEQEEKTVAGTEEARAP